MQTMKMKERVLGLLAQAEEGNFFAFEDAKTVLEVQSKLGYNLWSSEVVARFFRAREALKKKLEEERAVALYSGNDVVAGYAQQELDRL